MAVPADSDRLASLLLRRILPYTTVLTLLVIAYTGFALYTRHQASVDAERQIQEKQLEADRKTVAKFGGDQLTILGFNAADREVAPGGRALLCYGVSNAVRVSIEPGVEPVKPAISHCLEVFPRKTTTYTLNAEDAQGNKVTRSLTINVR